MVSMHPLDPRKAGMQPLLDSNKRGVPSQRAAWHLQLLTQPVERTLAIRDAQCFVPAMSHDNALTHVGSQPVDAAGPVSLCPVQGCAVLSRPDG